LIKRWALDEFNEDATMTVGCDFLNKVEVVEDQKINVQLWDIAGQERFTGLSRVCMLSRLDVMFGDDTRCLHLAFLHTRRGRYRCF
jgi:GTPase SAR1 family protein